MASRHRSSFDSFPTGTEPRRRSGAPRGREVGQAPQASASSSANRSASRYSRAAYGNAPSSDVPPTTGSAYSRRTTQADYARARSKKKRKKIVTGVLVALAAVLVVGAASAFAYMNVLNGKLTGDVGDDLKGVLTDSSTSDPFYVLLMGVDRSEARENSEQYAGDNFRSDSMILARIDPKEKQITLVSIVRDTYVDIDGYGWNKINAAHALGGPALTVQTVSEFAGVPISHYAEIDFDGFKAAVDALGGIEVDVPITIDDEKAGGHIDAGEQTLDGEQALILCRSRHAYDDVGGGDYYRAANQRMVMGAIAKKLLASDPATIASTVTSLCDYIDTDMKVEDIVSVALSLQGMDTDSDIYSTMNPTVSSYEGGVWYEYSNNEAWSAMMQRIDKGESPTVNEEDSANRGGVTDGTVDPEYVAQSALSDSGNTGEYDQNEVAVQNGNGVPGVAATVSSILTNNGYDVTTTDDADSYDYTNTLIVYEDGQEDTAQAIAEMLGLGTIMPNDGSYSYQGAALVIVGADYQG